MVLCKSTAKEVSFEWSHHRISSTDSKVRTTLHVSIIHSESERLNFTVWKNRMLQSGDKSAGTTKTGGQNVSLQPAALNYWSFLNHNF